MPTFAAILNSRSWFELRAMALTHGLKFNTHHTWQQAYARLHATLTTGDHLRQAVRALASREHEALIALQAGDGTLPWPVFAAQFGDIRPYRPWTADAPRHPWRSPVSVAEKLWFLGFIALLPGENGAQQQVCAPAEVLALLPPLPAPRPAPRLLPQSQATLDALRIDVALLLGLFLGHEVRTRWLSPRLLRALNVRLAAPDDLDGIRSELGSGRIRFLHYLAEAGGLVAWQMGMIKPTVAAWSWLNVPPNSQWRILWQTWEDDIQRREPLWPRYRLPPITPRLWAVLLDQLRALPPKTAHSIVSLEEAMCPHLVGELTALESVPDLLVGPLAWAGLVTAADEHFALTTVGADHFAGELITIQETPGNAQLALDDAALWIKLPPVPRLRPLVEVSAWATVDESGMRVDAAAVIKAVEQGHDLAHISSVLADLAGEPLSSVVQDKLAAWFRETNRLTLRRMTVLTSPDAELLAHLRADRYLRPMTVEPLSSHHLAVQPGRADELRRKLKRRGLRVAGHAGASNGSRPDGELSAKAAEYLWLAARIYQILGSLVPLDALVPGALLDWLAGQLPDGAVDGLEQNARGVLDRLAGAIAGQHVLSGGVAQDDPEGIQAAVEAAYASQGALTVEYFSPAHGKPTVRTIEPLMIYEHGGATYVEAWCQLDEAARTFRLDRILRVVDADNHG